MKALGLLLGAGVLALAAGQADATVSIYFGPGGTSNAASAPVASTTTSYANVNGQLTYTGRDGGFINTITGTGSPALASPGLSTTAVNIASMKGGDIAVYLVQSGVTAIGALTSSFTANTISGAGTYAELSTYYSLTDPFQNGMISATELASAVFTGRGTTESVDALAGVTKPFYEVTKFNVHFGATGGSVNNTIVLSAGAVPEPASWAMMLMGFGFMGYALRQRRGAKVSFG